MLIVRLLVVLVVAAALPGLSAAAQQVWEMQESGTTAGLRGIDSVDGTVAWASGTGGTVLKTVDGGAHWTRCAVPDGDKDGSTLDFRGVQAWDATTAIVMASGPGDKSRLYKTKDGCRSWKLLLINKDKEGFWDGFLIQEKQLGWLLGDPVRGRFTLLGSTDGGLTWTLQRNSGLDTAGPPRGAFAASNTALAAQFGEIWFVSGGQGGALSYNGNETKICLDDCPSGWNRDGKSYAWRTASIPIGSNEEASGAFSLGIRMAPIEGGKREYRIVAVGGEYTKPNDSTGTAAWSSDGGKTWTASSIGPHGYRSSVQWSESLKVWITAGTNGSDISRDDGKTWKPLDDGNWNALSLPFVVGPNGRIARLNPAALPRAK
jgi:hypothetical protein